VKIARPAASILLCFFMGAAWAGGELGWSHDTLTGQEARLRFMADSEQCMEAAKLLTELPQITSSESVPDRQDDQVLLKRQQLKKAVSCMSMRGWSASVKPALNAGP